MKTHFREALEQLYDDKPPLLQHYLAELKQDPNSRAFAPVAEVYRRMGRLDAAMSMCIEGLENHPEYLVGRLTLARCYYDKRDFDSACEQLEQVVQVSPENLAAQKLLGEVYEALNKEALALQAYKMALVLAPEDIELIERVNRMEQEQILAQLPMEAVSIQKEESVELESQEPDEPFRVESLSKILQAPTQTEITTTTLADIYAQQGRFEEALRILEKIYTTNGAPDVLTKIKQCREKMGVNLAREQKVIRLKKILQQVHKQYGR